MTFDPVFKLAAPDWEFGGGALLVQTRMYEPYNPASTGLNICQLETLRPGKIRKLISTSFRQTAVTDVDTSLHRLCKQPRRLVC